MDDYARLLKERRRELRLTLRQLGERCNINFRVLSRMERGERRPSAAEEQTLRRVLGIAGPAPDPVDSQHLLRQFNEPARFRPKSDRGLGVRLKAARGSYPFFDHLWSQIAAADRAFLHRVRIDSGAELLAIVRLLLAGGRPVLVSPLRKGLRDYPIVDPENRRSVGDCRVPGLVLGDVLIVFQVSLLSRIGVVTVDMAIKHRRRWCVLEVDGRGHLGNRDLERENAVRKLPTIRVCNEHLHLPTFAAVVAELVREATA